MLIQTLSFSLQKRYPVLNTTEENRQSPSFFESMRRIPLDTSVKIPYQQIQASTKNQTFLEKNPHVLKFTVFRKNTNITF